ncbi:hypothetical protein KSP40_PGU014056 [Platanthera guangdongensis]|uniref:Uncharacterized protein n=1 Tax=Platanthera guangdongensis TaxID=2320717 RepID=A0ABR2LFV2_9ASPA
MENECIALKVIAPLSASGVVLDAPEASKLLSTVAIALSNCCRFAIDNPSTHPDFPSIVFHVFDRHWNATTANPRLYICAPAEIARRQRKIAEALQVQQDSSFKNKVADSTIQQKVRCVKGQSAFNNR